MNIAFRFKSSSRRSAGALLLAGVIAGVTVGGGVGVFAAPSSKTVTVCVDKEDNHMNYSKNGKCKSHQVRLVLNQAGTAGAKGDTGAAGAKGETGAAGTNGTNGAKGETGAAGTNGTNGATGETGAAGAAGGARITEMSVCDGSDAGTVANELCKIGMTGPGGGSVFFIDYQDQFASFCASGDCNYLEASPTDADENGGDFKSDWCSDTSTDLDLGSDKSAIGAGRANTATADAMCTSGAVQAAVDYTAPAFNGVAKDDWWLPSFGELMAMHTNLRQAGVDSFILDAYWSSSQSSATHAWSITFSNNIHGSDGKESTFVVRPVRGF